MSTDVHKHKFDEPIEQKVRLGKYVYENGAHYNGDSGYDIIKSWKCKCGQIKAYDLERHLA